MQGSFPKSAKQGEETTAGMTVLDAGAFDCAGAELDVPEVTVLELGAFDCAGVEDTGGGACGVKPAAWAGVVIALACARVNAGTAASPVPGCPQAPLEFAS